MAKEPDKQPEQQIFFGDMPMHDLFQKQVQQVMEQADLDDESRAGDAGGAELSVLRRRWNELHRAGQPEEEARPGYLTATASISILKP